MSHQPHCLLGVFTTPLTMFVHLLQFYLETLNHSALDEDKKPDIYLT